MLHRGVGWVLSGGAVGDRVPFAAFTMKIAIACQHDRISSEVAAEFGRAPHYLIYDPDHMELSKLTKGHRDRLPPQGGLEVAVTLLDAGVGVVIAGQFGDHVRRFLREAGVRMVRSPRGAGSWALDRYLHDRLPAD